MKPKGFILTTLLLTLSLPFYLGCGANAEDEGKPEVKTQAVGPVAADFTLKNLDGEDVKLSDFKGKVIILDFWATWCPPCVKEIPHFNELAGEYADSGLVMLGISLDRGGVDVIKDFMETKTPIEYTVLMGDQKTGGIYQQYLPRNMRGGIPFTFVINREGVIRDHYVGYRPKEVFVDAIKPLL